MTPARDAVIFDLYGTLAEIQVDESRSGFWKELAGALGVERVISGARLQQTYMRLAIEAGRQQGTGFVLDRVFPALLQEIGLAATSDAVLSLSARFRSLSTVRLDKMGYTDELLARLKTAGHRIGLLSNTEELLTSHDLRALDLADRFDQVVLSSSFGVGKPDRRIFLEMLVRLRCDPSRAVFVGDNLDEDVGGAVDAGIDAVLLTSGPQSVREEVERRFGSRTICAEFRLDSIVAALASHGVRL